MDFLRILSVFTLAVLSPGPDFLVVLRSALGGGSKKALAAAAGIATGTSLWALGTLSGIVVALRSFPVVATVAQIVGAVFLSLYGFSILWGTWKARTNSAFAVESEDFSSLRSHFRLGFVTTTIGNPKALIFYSLIFVSLLPSEVSWGFAALLVILMTFLSFSWFALVSFVASSRVFLSLYRRYGWLVDALLGTLFVVLGVALLL